MAKRSERSLRWETALRDAKERQELIFGGLGRNDPAAKPLDPASGDYEAEIGRRLSNLAELYGLDWRADEHAWRKLALSLAIDLLPAFRVVPDSKSVGEPMSAGEVYLRQMHVYRQTNPTLTESKIRENVANETKDIRQAMDAIDPPDRLDRGDLKAESVKTAVKRYKRSASSEYTKEERAVIRASDHFRTLFLVAGRLSKLNFNRPRIQALKAARSAWWLNKISEQ
jgi:hypothetical protein